MLSLVEQSRIDLSHLTGLTLAGLQSDAALLWPPGLPTLTPCLILGLLLVASRVIASGERSATLTRETGEITLAFVDIFSRDCGSVPNEKLNY